MSSQEESSYSFLGKHQLIPNGDPQFTAFIKMKNKILQITYWYHHHIQKAPEGKYKKGLQSLVMKEKNHNQKRGEKN